MIQMLSPGGAGGPPARFVSNSTNARAGRQCWKAKTPPTSNSIEPPRRDDATVRIRGQGRTIHRFSAFPWRRRVVAVQFIRLCFTALARRPCHGGIGHSGTFVPVCQILRPARWPAFTSYLGFRAFLGVPPYGQCRDL